MDLSLNAARHYGAARPLTSPDLSQLGGSQSPSARSTVAEMADNFLQTLHRAEQASEASMAGTGDPHALIGALTEAQLAVETVVAVRDRVVEAYMEILRMPV